MIRIEHLRKEYPTAVPLKDVNVEIHKGDVVSVIGPSGTGKSTLIRCINLLDKPTSGKIFIDGETPKQYFDDFVFGPEVERGKPNPDIFLKAAEKLGEAPEKCLVLEDSQAGIQAAYAANIPVICIPDLKKPSEEYRKKTTAVLESLNDVIDFLNEKD